MNRILIVSIVVNKIFSLFTIIIIIIIIIIISSSSSSSSSIIINLHPVGETTWGRMTNSYTVSTV